ncbi:hypothetical protein A9Q96_16580 [Rhodobacterales bacterium 52_120_T64]|nr:hypothetical protein A9Q96_16580 [Rhodobacterales bacterium 52_120_T64]
MSFIRNILALLGVAAIGVMVWIGPTAYRYKVAFDGFDEKSIDIYKGLGERLIAHGNAVGATVWSAKVAEGLTFEEVDQSIRNIAIERNIRGVGALPLGDQVAAMTGSPWRKLNIYLYCNPLTAAKMVEHDIAYAAYLPCRVSLVEDEHGDLWLYTLDMDLMIYGGKSLPPELLEEALHVKDIMLDILERAAEGDF